MGRAATAARPRAPLSGAASGRPDARAPGVRPEVTQVFDLDGPILASHAAAAGLAEFARRAAAAGATLPLLAGVAVYTDERSARVLSAFPGLRLDRDRVAAVLSAPDPVEGAAVKAAVGRAVKDSTRDGSL